MDAATDEDLAGRVQNGNRDALERLVRRYVRPIHAVVASYLSEPADVEDAAQETFLRAIRGIRGYDPHRPFAPWLYQIARNVARNQLAARARWRMEPLADRESESERRGPEVELELSEIRELVDASIGRLPEQQRTVFRLSDVEGYSTGEIARIMGIAPGTVRSHLHHARQALRIELTEPLGELINPGG